MGIFNLFSDESQRTVKVFRVFQGLIESLIKNGTNVCENQLLPYANDLKRCVRKFAEIYEEKNGKGSALNALRQQIRIIETDNRIDSEKEAIITYRTIIGILESK